MTTKKYKTHATSKFGEDIIHESQNAKIKCRECSIIIEGKFHTFENLKTFIYINGNLSCNSKTVVYIIKCTN